MVVGEVGLLNLLLIFLLGRMVFFFLSEIGS
jgi:hypothetical protein